MKTFVIQYFIFTIIILFPLFIQGQTIKNTPAFTEPQKIIQTIQRIEIQPKNINQQFFSQQRQPDIISTFIFFKLREHIVINWFCDIQQPFYIIGVAQAGSITKSTLQVFKKGQ